MRYLVACIKGCPGSSAVAWGVRVERLAGEVGASAARDKVGVSGVGVVVEVLVLEGGQEARGGNAAGHLVMIRSLEAASRHEWGALVLEAHGLVRILEAGLAEEALLQVAGGARASASAAEALSERLVVEHLVIAIGLLLCRRHRSWEVY